MANVDVSGLSATLAKTAASWKAAVNEIAELDLGEFLKLLGYNPPPDSGELTLAAREALASTEGRVESARAAPAAYGAVTAPASFDLRNVGGANYITPVRNQRSCGSCVAFGSIATVEGTMRFARQDANFAIDLSEGHLFNCIARSQGRACAGNNGGWWVDPAMRALRDQGVVDEACSPYSPADQPCVLCADEAQRRVRILSFEELRSVAAMKEWISTKGPLAACFTVYDDFSAYATGVYRKTSNVSRGGHCVCVVGYDDASSAWICKNSWGTGWGESGYFRIGYGECGIDASMWGVQTGASPTPGGTYLPLYRYWNPEGGDHFYTTSWQEVGEGRWGWGYEGVQCFVAPSQLPGTAPLYRYWNPDIADHFYTTSWDELAEGRWGWGYEGVQCYVWPTAAGSSGGAPATFRVSGRAGSARAPVLVQPKSFTTSLSAGPGATLPATFRTTRLGTVETVPGTFRTASTSASVSPHTARAEAAGRPASDEDCGCRGKRRS